MTTNTLIRCIEEAAEFGDRFPDECESTVLGHVTYVMKLSANLEPDWGISRCIMCAYDWAEVEKGIESAKYWGFLKEDFTYEAGRLYI